MAGHQPRARGSSHRRGLQSGRQQTSSQHLYTPNVCLKSGRSEHPAAGSHASAWSCGSAPVPGPAPRPRPRARWLSRAACLPRAPLLGALRTPAFHTLTPRPVPPGARGLPGPSLTPCGDAGDAAAAGRPHVRHSRLSLQGQSSLPGRYPSTRGREPQPCPAPSASSWSPLGTGRYEEAFTGTERALSQLPPSGQKEAVRTQVTRPNTVSALTSEAVKAAPLLQSRGRGRDPHPGDTGLTPRTQPHPWDTGLDPPREGWSLRMLPSSSTSWAQTGLHVNPPL